MKKKKQVIVIILSALFVLIGSASYMLFGPIYVNFNSEKIAALSFTIPNEETIEVEEAHKDELIQKFDKINYFRMPMRCKCAGSVKVIIDYENQNQVEFDGYYLKKTYKNGRTISHPTKNIAASIYEIYLEYVNF